MAALREEGEAWLLQNAEGRVYADTVLVLALALTIADSIVASLIPICHGSVHAACSWSVATHIQAHSNTRELCGSSHLSIFLRCHFSAMPFFFSFRQPICPPRCRFCERLDFLPRDPSKLSAGFLVSYIGTQLKVK